MITSSCIAEINWCLLKLAKKVSDNTQSTSSRQSLYGSSTGVVDDGMVPMKESHTSTSVEFSESIFGKILLIKSVVCNDFSLNFAHNWEHIWLSIFVSVGYYSQVYFYCLLLSILFFYLIASLKVPILNPNSKSLP